MCSWKEWESQQGNTKGKIRDRRKTKWPENPKKVMTTTWPCISILKSFRVSRETNFSEGLLTHFPSPGHVVFGRSLKIKWQNENSLENVSKVRTPCNQENRNDSLKFGRIRTGIALKICAPKVSVLSGWVYCRSWLMRVNRFLRVKISRGRLWSQLLFWKNNYVAVPWHHASEFFGWNVTAP